MVLMKDQKIKDKLLKGQVVCLSRLKEMRKREILLYFNYWREQSGKFLIMDRTGRIKNVLCGFMKEYIIPETFSPEDLEKMTKKEIIHICESLCIVQSRLEDI